MYKTRKDQRIILTYRYFQSKRIEGINLELCNGSVFVLVVLTLLIKASTFIAQLSHDETRIYALTGDGLFSAWSLVQTSQKLFGTQLQDPYFTEPENYKRSFW